MSTILSCTDGSIYAASIYDHTIWAARRLGSGIRVLHMLEPMTTVPLVSDFSGVIGPDAQTQLASELVALEAAQTRVNETRSRALLAAAREHLVKGGVKPDDIRTDVVEGELVDALATFGDTTDLVVIGKRGEHADFAKGHLGSNLERVIRTSRQPVLVASRAFRPIERILIAWDGSPSVQKAVDHAVSQPLLKGLRCRLLSVGESDVGRATELANARDRLVAAGYEVEASHVPGEVGEVITATVTGESIGLLVMGAYGHSRLRQFFVGSTTSDMIRSVQIPVLLFRS
ncbi:universal stress protein UspA-like protein [Opitutaceae bacterium TAV1]|nr:universal stress protein UspA [Opitutaceae bacterium TAV5]EIP97679.1 universal stress protein UspA-like protein [Opitutaceae bacterium TAV1]